MRFVVHILLIIATAFVAEARADLSYTPGRSSAQGGVVPLIRVHGVIRESDALQFQSLMAQAKESARSSGINPLNQFPLIVELDSSGGSVRAAISIGGQIRAANPFSVNVQQGASCISACVLILAGGVSRYVQGAVGIHRPYYDDDKAFTSEQQRRNYSVIEKDVKDYLTSVNVPTSLYDMMFRIPPEKVRFLNDKELQSLGLNEDDPFYKEASDAQMAKRAGLSKSEFQRRQAVCARSRSADEASACYGRFLKTH